MFYSVDRFEDNALAVLVGDDDSEKIIPISEFDFEIKKNDILLYDPDTGTFTYDEEETLKRKEQIKKRVESLFNRKK